MGQQKYYYTCTPQVLQGKNGKTRNSFRLNVLASPDGKRAQLLFAVNDVCGSESRARQLEALLYRNQVSPKHIIDVLENWLP